MKRRPELANLNERLFLEQSVSCLSMFTRKYMLTFPIQWTGFLVKLIYDVQKLRLKEFDGAIQYSSHGQCIVLGLFNLNKNHLTVTDLSISLLEASECQKWFDPKLFQVKLRIVANLLLICSKRNGNSVKTLAKYVDGNQL